MYHNQAHRHHPYQHHLYPRRRHFQPANKTPSQERDRLQDRSRRAVDSVNARILRGEDLTALNSTQRHYARTMYPQQHPGDSTGQAHRQLDLRQDAAREIPEADIKDSTTAREVNNEATLDELIARASAGLPVTAESLAKDPRYDAAPPATIATPTTGNAMHEQATTNANAVESRPMHAHSGGKQKRQRKPRGLLNGRLRHVDCEPIDMARWNRGTTTVNAVVPKQESPEPAVTLDQISTTNAVEKCKVYEQVIARLCTGYTQAQAHLRSIGSMSSDPATRAEMDTVYAEMVSGSGLALRHLDNYPATLARVRPDKTGRLGGNFIEYQDYGREVDR